ncbi:MAG: ACT domain-containing protein, partial [Rikenellaceae bacterium]
ALETLGVKPSGNLFKKVLPAYGCTDKNEFYSKLGAGIINISNLKSIVRSSAASKLVKYWSLQVGNTLKFLGGSSSSNKEEHNDVVEYKIAECCFPTPGDEVIGFSNEKGNLVTVHKKSCDVAIKLAAQNAASIVDTQWSSEKIMSYLSHLRIKGRDRMGILLDLSQLLTKQLNINIRKMHIVSHDEIFEGYVTVYVKNDKDLSNIINKISSIKGIESVTKTSQEELYDL